MAKADLAEAGSERILAVLKHGEILAETGELLPWGSNYTFVIVVRDHEYTLEAIYKPRRGERPLWDFPNGTLCQREVAAFLVSEALGWGIVPPTTLRDGPHGIGMYQMRLDADPNKNYFTLDAEFRPQLQRFALFDHIINNADRKGGHCLVTGDNKLWAIDHGICFNIYPKLRTVIWDYAGQAIPANLLEDLRMLCGKLAGDAGLNPELGVFLSEREIGALLQRVESLLEQESYPEPGPGRNYPWPPV